MIALNLDDVTLFERSNEQNFVLDTIWTIIFNAVSFYFF